MGCVSSHDIEHADGKRCRTTFSLDKDGENNLHQHHNAHSMHEMMGVSCDSLDTVDIDDDDCDIIVSSKPVYVDVKESKFNNPKASKAYSNVEILNIKKILRNKRIRSAFVAYIIEQTDSIDLSYLQVITK